jgi:hypothetical protein
MAITFHTEAAGHVIRTRAKGIVTCADILSHLKAKTDKGLLTYGEVFDARDVILDLSHDDLHQIAHAVQKATGTRKPGPIAVVTNSAFIHGLATAYAAMTTKQNPAFEVFADRAPADKWLREAVKSSFDPLEAV